MAVGSAAQRYASLKYALLAADILSLAALLFFFQASGLSYLLAQKAASLCPPGPCPLIFYTVIAGCAYLLVMFPLHFFQGFVLEHRFLLSRQSFPRWMSDHLKAAAVSYCILLLFLCAFYWLVRRFARHWWLLLSALWLLFSFLFARIVPLFLIPLFYKCRKVSDEGLRKRILALAEKMGVGVIDVYEFDLSAKTAKANAALTGMGKSRRILLADTLKEKYTHEEIEVIIAHELAHHKLKHIPKLIVFNALAVLALFYFVYLTGPAASAFFGAGSLADLAALPIVGLYAVLFGVITQPLGNFMNRCFERHADECALSVTRSFEAFISAFQKLSSQNLADENPHPIIKSLFFDHPPVSERIAMAHALRASGAG